MDLKGYSQRNADERRQFLAQPQRWNRYVYALNNPLTFSDPDGRDVINKATDQTTKNTVDLAKKFSPMIQNIDKNHNIIHTVVNGSTADKPSGENGGSTEFVKLDGKTLIKTTIDTSKTGSPEATEHMVREELGRAVQMVEKPDEAAAAAKTAKPGEHPMSDEALQKGDQIKKDIDAGQAAEAAKKKEKTP